VPKARVRIHVENNAETEALRFTPAHLERILAAHPGLGERLAVTINDDPDRTDGQSDAEILFAVRKPKSLADAKELSGCRAPRPASRPSCRSCRPARF